MTLKQWLFGLVLFGGCIPAQVQTTRTQGLGRMLADSDRIGDPDPRAQTDPLWVLAISPIPVSLDGYLVFQGGNHLSTLRKDKSTFDPTSPFCVVALDLPAPSAVDADPEIPPGQQLQANVIAMQPNPVDLGPYHLMTDLLRVRIQRSGGAVVLGFMWPREAGSATPLRRGALVGELREILGSRLEFGRGQITPREESGLTVFSTTTSVVNFEVLIQDKQTKEPISHVRLDQFRVYEGCAPEEGPSCKPVDSLRLLTAEEREGTVNFIVLPEIGGLVSHRTTIRDAVSRLVDFTSPKDRAAIVPYYERAAIWQPLTSDKHVYQRRANNLFDADVGSKTVRYINTYGAVATALNDVASREPNQRNVILLITEGHDCFNPYQIAKMAAERNTSIWVLDLTGTNQMELKPLAEMSGGLYFRVNSYDTLMKHIEDFAGMWKKVYLLSYQSKSGDAGPTPRREIRVVDTKESLLTVSKGFRGPQVVADMYNPEQPHAPSDASDIFSTVRSVEDLVPLIHQINSDSAFVELAVRAIGFSTSIDEFFTFLENIDHIATPKRRKTIGHLITSHVDTFARMNPSAEDWLRLRASAGNAEDWKLMTEFFLPKLQRAVDFLQALDVRSIPETAGFTDETNRAVVAGVAFAHFPQFRMLKPAPPEIDDYVLLLDQRRRIPALIALGARSLERLGPEMRSAFGDIRDTGQSLSLLDDLLRSTSEAGQFWAIVNLYATSRPDAGFVASQAVLDCLKTLASFPAPQTTIPEALKWARNSSEKLSVMRELNGSLAQIDELKDEAEDDSRLIAVYLAAVAKARSADELILALWRPSHPRFARAHEVCDHMIEAEIWQFAKKATTPKQYLALSDQTDTQSVKRKVLNAGVSALLDTTARERLKSALERIKDATTKNGGTVK